MRLKALAAILSAAAIILLAVRQRSTTPPPRALVKSESKASEVARTRDAEARAADADHVAQEAKGDAERREELNQALRARAQAADAAASAAEAREQASNARAAAAERRAARAEAALRAAKPVAAAGAPARGLTLPRLDPQRMVASWAEAQELLGLNRTAAENIELVLGFYNMSRGCGHHRHVRYVMMSKVASEDISGNMRAWAHGERTDPANCTFTFVREPLKKFISGAVEMEWRFRQGQKRRGDDDMGSWRFHRLPVGSRDRSVAFLKDLLEFKWAVVPRALGYRGGLAHIYPMFGQVATWQPLVGLDFIGRLENFAVDWARMQAVCGTGHALTTAVSRPTSRRPTRCTSSPDGTRAR